MAAVDGVPAMRTFVVERLSKMSRLFGTAMPLTAKELFERHWASGETRWDTCFERPYAFTMQIAVNISQLSLLRYLFSTQVLRGHSTSRVLANVFMDMKWSLFILPGVFILSNILRSWLHFTEISIEYED
ncbi:hypothetical protein EJ08DRAFT_707890 [Tothia fuscella]|uniref:Uncharacterized protein n=1 Tax=Tothia fuscella TaxID=1048955 RepID=A0A9P4NXD7_9PEZI|nr:hypothetical protein EJ08DRAFT_707890 [Tothia fuscella]